MARSQVAEPLNPLSSLRALSRLSVLLCFQCFSGSIDGAIPQIEALFLGTPSYSYTSLAEMQVADNGNQFICVRGGRMRRNSLGFTSQRAAGRKFW